MLGQRIIDNQRFGIYGNCVINTWSGLVRSDHLAAFDAAVGEVAPLHPEGVVFFVVIEQGSPLLDSEQRKEIEAVYARWAPSMRAVAQVVEGGNLWSVTIRSLMTAIRLVQRRPYPIKVFTEVGEGVQWAAQYVTKPTNDKAPDSAQGLATSIEQLRALPIAS